MLAAFAALLVCQLAGEAAARAFQVNELAGVAMALNGIATAILVPMILGLMR